MYLGFENCQKRLSKKEHYPLAHSKREILTESLICKYSLMGVKYTFDMQFLPLKIRNSLTQFFKIYLSSLCLNSGLSASSGCSRMQHNSLHKNKQFFILFCVSVQKVVSERIYQNQCPRHPFFKEIVSRDEYEQPTSKKKPFCSSILKIILYFPTCSTRPLLHITLHKR
jgi:hypothetical protein